MLNEDIKKCTDILLENSKMDLIYMLEHDIGVNFMFVSAVDVSNDVIDLCRKKLKKLLSGEINIFNMSSFSAEEKVNVMRYASLIYCASDFMKRLFEADILSAVKSELEDRNKMLERKTECASFYLQ